MSKLRRTATFAIISTTLSISACGGGAEDLSLEPELGAASSGFATVDTDSATVIEQSSTLVLAAQAQVSTDVVVESEAELVPAPLVESEPVVVPDPVVPEPVVVPEPLVESEPVLVAVPDSPSEIVQPDENSTIDSSVNNEQITNLPIENEPEANVEPEIGAAEPEVVTQEPVTSAPVVEPEQSSSDSTSIIVGNDPGDAHCINLSNDDIGFGSLNKADWERWVSDVRFTIGDEHLSVEDTADGKVIRQQYVPSSKGSDRVIVAADLDEHRTYRLTQTVFFEDGWDWGGEKSQGGKLGFGLGGGTTPSGGTTDPNGFTARILWRGNLDGTAKIGIYSYAADRPKIYGEDVYFGEFLAPIGEWFQFTIEVQTNSSTDAYDGRMRAWVNGELMLDRENVGWQLGGSKPVVDSLFYSSFYGGSTAAWSPDKTTHAKVKDVCWAPVVDGYSGIDPDAGRNKVTTTVNEELPIDDGPFAGGEEPLWYSARATTLELVEKSRVLMQINAPSTSVEIQSQYAQAIAKLNTARTYYQNTSGNTLNNNPLPLVASVIQDMQLIVELHEQEGTPTVDAITLLDMLEVLAVNSVNFTVAVAQNALIDNSCDINAFDVSISCENAYSHYSSAESNAELWSLNRGTDLLDAMSYAQEAWSDSVASISSAKQ